MADQWRQLSVQWSKQWRSDHIEQSMVANDGCTMVATDGRTMVATDGLINGGNGAIIQSNRWLISGGN